MKEMTDTCGGVFVQDFVLFYGENLQYYITEESSGEQSITESNNLSLMDTDISDNNGVETRFSMLNDMMVSFEMHEEKTLSEMANEYMIMSKLGDLVFTVK